MILNQNGTVVRGSSDIQTSSAETEILDRKYIGFELYNDQACHISINGGDYIYVRISQGISVDIAWSIKIKEADITFNWIGVEG